MILARLVPLAALLLAGCGEADQAAPPRPVEDSGSPARAAPETPDASRAKTPPANVAVDQGEGLVGEYRVAGVGGRDIDLPHGITARITSDGIHVASDCVNLSWNYFFEGTALVTERLPVESCGRGLLPEEEAIVAVFDGATRVRRTPANGLEFAGENGAVLLFGQ